MSEQEKIYISFIGEKIGHGGYGSVYKAIISEKLPPLNNITKYKIQENDKEVAIKYVEYSKYNGVESIIEAFIVKCVNHKYIIHASNVDIHLTGKLQIIFPLARADAATAIRKNHLKPKPQVLKKWFWQLTCAVAHLHSLGIVHADIKGGNVLLFGPLPLPIAGNGEYTMELENVYVQLADFSLAVVIPDPEKGTKDLPNSFSYTPTHRSTEVWKGEYWSYPADIWSLGCTFYELNYESILFPSHQGYKNEIEASVNCQIEWCNKDFSSPIMSRTRSLSKSTSIRPTTRPIAIPVSVSVSTKSTILSKSAPINSCLIVDSKPCNISTNWFNYENKEINEVILSMLVLDPRSRINIWELLEHPYFESESLEDIPLHENRSFPHITYGVDNIPNSIMKEIDESCGMDNHLNSLSLSLYLKYHTINPKNPISSKTCVLIAHKLLYKIRPLNIDKITNSTRDEEILLCKTLKFHLFSHI